MKTAVLIPSHINYPDQIDRLDTCLESLLNQTIGPDIFLSVSFSNDTYKRNFSSILRKYPTVKYTFSAEQKFQMEHLCILSKKVLEYDMILFCDDDDKYHPMRNKLFIQYFQETKKLCYKQGLQFGGVREIQNVEDLDTPPEYWAYGIPPKLLTQFFQNFEGENSDLLCNKFADMYLRNYLKRTGKDSLTFSLLAPDSNGRTLYQYTIDNPNSICSHHNTQEVNSENANTLIRDNILLYLICEEDELLHKYLHVLKIKPKQLKEVFPESERIKGFIQVLYK